LADADRLEMRPSPDLRSGLKIAPPVHSIDNATIL
jgi:hypothetical protein